MNIPNNPITGIAENIEENFIFLLSNILLIPTIEPDLKVLPSVNSPISPVVPSKNTNKKYGIKNAAPPYVPNL